MTKKTKIKNFMLTQCIAPSQSKLEFHCRELKIEGEENIRKAVRYCRLYEFDCPVGHQRIA
jgi:hypothetical protein